MPITWMFFFWQIIFKWDRNCVIMSFRFIHILPIYVASLSITHSLTILFTTVICHLEIKLKYAWANFHMTLELQHFTFLNITMRIKVLYKHLHQYIHKREHSWTTTYIVNSVQPRASPIKTDYSKLDREIYSQLCPTWGFSYQNWLFYKNNHKHVIPILPEWSLSLSHPDQ